MVLLDEQKQQVSQLTPEIRDLADALGVEAKKRRLEELETRSAMPEFYDDPSKSSQVFSEMSGIRSQLERYGKLTEMLADAETLLELWDEGDDEAAGELETLVPTLAEETERLRLVTLLTGEYDANNALLTFHAGAGGTEAQDWVEMLLRMYQKYAANHGFKTTVLDFLDGEEAGIKSATLLVEGENAYGFLKSENGVHRLVRISPFDSSGRRHTSFASLEVMPEIEEDKNVQIRSDDIKMDVYRASGAGGQHVNKTSSAVRLTHLPTGIVVASQAERSQVQNRETAMKMLISKLVQIKEREHLDKIDDIKGVQKEIAWGSQIRSYVFMPYTLVKDHRTSFENGNVGAVMDGELDGFINAYLKAASKGELKDAASAGDDD
ncbi:peptide chain release factor 2 [Ruminococcaceae bacterium OttesenSCG-928-D13]|nr:peptide chain release factor 2 [Ruminococcaceae bacterium OttesenSCG-928-D13]